MKNLLNFNENLIVLIFSYIFLLNILFSCQVLYPISFNIAPFKPLRLSPTGSTCGLEFKDTLCDNRIEGNRCNSNSIFFCDQTCPFGNVLENLNEIEQIKLDNMNPCTVIQDFNTLITNVNPKTQYSYYFDLKRNLCARKKTLNNQDTQNEFFWRFLSLESTYLQPSLSFYNFRTPGLAILDSGFTFSSWFKQQPNNNGFGIFFLNMLTIVFI